MKIIFIFSIQISLNSKMCLCKYEKYTCCNRFSDFKSNLKSKYKSHVEIYKLNIIDDLIVFQYLFSLHATEYRVNNK